jgi:ribonucleoside-diphosphate reductase alpha chain
MLDNVIDLNFYPLRKVKSTNQNNRAIGLGVMGEAQMLAEHKIEWGSDEHFRKIDEIMEMVSYNAIYASSDLAVEKGNYPEFEGSKWSQGIMPIDLANKEVLKIVDRGGLFGYEYNWDDLKSKVNSYLILSGIIDKYKQNVLQKYSDFDLVEEIPENEWVTLIFKRK